MCHISKRLTIPMGRKIPLKFKYVYVDAKDSHGVAHVRRIYDPPPHDALASLSWLSNAARSIVPASSAFL